MHLDQDTAPLAVSAACVGMALPFRAERDIRYYINGIFITPDPNGGAIIVAADGYTMAVVYDPTGRAPTGGMILPVSKGQAVMLRKGGQLLAGADGRAFITDEDGTVLWIAPATKIEGKFPDYAAVIPDPSALAPGLIGECNPAYLERIRRARAASGRHKWEDGVRWWNVARDPLRSVSVAAFAPNAVALIMPVYSQSTNSSLADHLPPSLRARGNPQEAA